MVGNATAGLITGQEMHPRPGHPARDGHRRHPDRQHRERLRQLLHRLPPGLDASPPACTTSCSPSASRSSTTRTSARFTAIRRRRRRRAVAELMTATAASAPSPRAPDDGGEGAGEKRSMFMDFYAAAARARMEKAPRWRSRSPNALRRLQFRLSLVPPCQLLPSQLSPCDGSQRSIGACLWSCGASRSVVPLSPVLDESAGGRPVRFPFSLLRSAHGVISATRMAFRDWGSDRARLMVQRGSLPRLKPCAAPPLRRACARRVTPRPSVPVLSHPIKARRGVWPKPE